ncbi:MAG: hypothetical protein Tsb0020_21720 [Haliangiales bacterium]
MSRQHDDPELKKFLETLHHLNGTAGNSRLMNALAWDEDKYWRLRDILLNEGRIVRGRGRGGSVIIVEETAEAASPPAEVEKEVELYEPCKKVLEEHWTRERTLQSYHVEITAMQGRRATGGKWTRPDISALSVRTFPHWPGRFFDLWTFEIKPRWAFDVTGVFEAAAHSRSATHSYAMFHVDDEPDEETVLRCITESQRFGVGLVLFTDPTDFEKWDFKIDPIRHEPDPALLEEFVATQLSQTARTKLLRWGK